MKWISTFNSSTAEKSAIHTSLKLAGSSLMNWCHARKNTAHMKHNRKRDFWKHARHPQTWNQQTENSWSILRKPATVSKNLKSLKYLIGGGDFVVFLDFLT